MNFIQRLFGAPEQRALSFDQLGLTFGATPTASGVSVTAETALRSPTVLAAVRAISETVGMLPIAFRVRDGTAWKKISDHPAARLLSGFANPWTDAAQLRTQLTIDAILHRAGGFAQVIRVQGEPRELHRLAPASVRVFADPNSSEPRYEVTDAGGRKAVLNYSDVVHVHVPGWSLDRPLGLIDLAREAIAIDLSMAAHQAKTFATGGLPRIVLTPRADSISPEAMKNALDFFKMQARSGNSGDPIVLPAAFQEAFQSFGLGSMQFLELRRLVIEEIARALRVPVQLLGDTSKSTFNNVESQSRNFLVYSLLPWLEMWEGALTRALIPAAERIDFELEFVTEDLLRGDTPTRFTAYRNAGGGAWMTRNEIRALEGLPAVPGGDLLLNQAGQTGADSGEPATDGNTDAAG